MVMDNYWLKRYMKILKTLHPAYLISSGLKEFKYVFEKIYFEEICKEIHILLESEWPDKEEVDEFRRELKRLLFDFEIMKIQSYDFEYYMESHFDAIVGYLEKRERLDYRDFLYFINTFDDIFEYITINEQVRDFA